MRRTAAATERTARVAARTTVPNGWNAPGAVRIMLPHGETLTTDDADVHAALSAAFGRPVTIWLHRPASDLDHYRSGTP